jgi:DNA ligase 1
MGLTNTSKYSQVIDYADHRYDGADMAADWIRDLESSDSRLHKERVIEKALMAAKLGSASAQGFLYNCYLALNPYYVYGVKKVPESEGLEDRPNPWTRFWALCESLRTRSVTGGDAQATIREVMADFDSEQWNGMARRVLIKDLRCGVSEKTINKICKNSDWRIPVFECQLAQDSTDQPNKLKGRMRLEVKLDGVRVLAVFNGNSVTLYSRNGKEFQNFKEIAQFLGANRNLFQHGTRTGGRFVLDGEIVGESFQKLMRQAHRKSDAETAGMVYHVFDFIPLDDFERGHWNAQQHKRLACLDLARERLANSDMVQIMPGMEVDLDTAEGHDIMRRFAEASVDEGYEGIMIKSLDAPYECKRSSFWMKWKPTISVDLNIVGFEEGTGRNKCRLGAIICEGEDNGRRIRVNVGGGFSDSDRDQYWVRRDLLLDHIVEVQADAVTQNQDGTYSLRFPRFLRFRDFEAGSKL